MRRAGLIGGIALALVTGALTVSPGAAALTQDWQYTYTVSRGQRQAETPAVVVDAQGNTTAVFWEGDTFSGVIMAARRPVHGSWHTATSISGTFSSRFIADTHPSIGIDAKGDVTAVWGMVDLKKQTLYIETATMSPKGSWSAPVVISQSGVLSYSPVLAVSSKGAASAAWLAKASNGKPVVQAAIRPGRHASWGSAATLSSAKRKAADPRIAINAHGDSAAAWRYQYNSTYSAIQARIRPAGSAWGARSLVSTQYADSGDPSLAAVGTDAFEVSWSQDNGVNYIINTSRSAVLAVAWSAAAPLSSGGEDAYSSQLAVDQAGDVSAIWQWGDPNTTTAQIQTSTEPAGTFTWSTPSTLSDPSHQATAPLIVSDARGDLVAAWLQSDGSNDLASAAVSPAGGSGWGSAKALSATGQAATSPSLAASAEGNVALVWTRNDGSWDRIQTSRYDLAPPLTWMLGQKDALPKATDFPVSWSAGDWSGAGSFSLRVDTAPWDGTFAGNTAWVPGSITSPKTYEWTSPYTGQPGETDCLSVQATDGIGITGGWSNKKCFTVPVDDTSGTTSSGWQRMSVPDTYQGTITASSKKGATLTFPNARGRSFRILVTEKVDGGKFQLSFDGVNLGTFNTAASAANKLTLTKVRTSLPKDKTGDLVITVLGTGVVRVDGVYVIK